MCPVFCFARRGRPEDSTRRSRGVVASRPRGGVWRNPARDPGVESQKGWECVFTRWFFERTRPAKQPLPSGHAN